MKAFESSPGNVFLARHHLTPFEVLNLQAKGRRPVGIHYLSLESKVGRFPDPLEFFIHDLEHLYHFTENQQTHQRQQQFFQLLLHALKSSDWSGVCKKPSLRQRLIYLMCDMNGHTIYLAHYLRACLRDFPTLWESYPFSDYIEELSFLP